MRRCRGTVYALALLPLRHAAWFCTLGERVHFLPLCDWSCFARGRGLVLYLPGLSFGDACRHGASTKVGSRLHVSLLHGLLGNTVSRLLISALPALGVEADGA